MSCSLKKPVAALPAVDVNASAAVWPYCDAFEMAWQQFSPKVSKIIHNFWAIFKNGPFQVKSAAATFWSTFGKYWATFYSNIWLHCSTEKVKLVDMKNQWICSRKKFLMMQSEFFKPWVENNWRVLLLNICNLNWFTTRWGANILLPIHSSSAL